MLVVSTTALAPFALMFDQFHLLVTPFSVGDYAILVQIGTSIFAYILLPLPELDGVSCYFPRPIVLEFGWRSYLSLLDWRWSR
jgi:hypothetical protein